MRTRVFSPIATIVSLLLLVAVPAQASPIKFADVVNIMGDMDKGGRIEQLRLRVAQDPSAPGTVSGNKSGAGSVAPAADGDAAPAPASSALSSTSEGVAPSLMAGTEV